MLRPWQNLILVTALAVFWLGCSSMSRLEKAVFKNSTLSNLNPAPKKLSPPEKVGGGDLIDPVYLRTQADYHYALGEALSLEGQTARAVEEFKLTLVYDKDSTEVRLRMAQEYIKQGLLSEAIEQAEQVVELDPESLDGRLLLGGLYSSLRMYALSHKQYEFLLITYPDNTEVPVYLGALMAEQGKYDEAEEIFQNLAENPKNEDPAKAHYFIGRIRSEQKQKKFLLRAEKAYLRALGHDPKREEIVLALSKLYEKMEKPKQAQKLLISYQDRFGPKKEVARVLSVGYLEEEKYDEALAQLEIIEGFEPDNLNVKVKVALILIEQKNYDGAIEKLEEIIRVSPESDKIRFYLGAVYEEVKKPKSAIFHFDKIEPSSMYYSEAVIHSAYMWKVLGEVQKSVDTVKRGIKNKDDVPQFYAFYASLLDDMKKYRTAINMLEKAIVKFPEHTQLLFFLGSMLDRVGKKQQTIAKMKRVLEIDENHVQALNYLAYTYADKGENLEVAEALAFKALGLSPEDGYILDTVGWVMFKRGRFEEAIKYLEAAHKNVGDESIIAEHLGDAYYRNELLDKAKKMYLKAMANAKDEDKIREIRTKLATITKQKDSRKPASYNPKKPAQPAQPTFGRKKK